tara:strand:+ start:542 stop:745 length:204 start_codon:yes stop_codon:yes gene_type:complete
MPLCELEPKSASSVKNPKMVSIDMLVFGSIHLCTKFIGRFPEGYFDVFGHNISLIIESEFDLKISVL